MRLLEIKPLVAFANTAGGTLLVGVEDGTKRVRGVPAVMDAEERLANLIANSIRPRLVPDIEVVPWRKLNILAVQVYPGNTRPHYWKSLALKPGASSTWARRTAALNLPRSRNSRG